MSIVTVNLDLSVPVSDVARLCGTSIAKLKGSATKKIAVRRANEMLVEYSSTGESKLKEPTVTGISSNLVGITNKDGKLTKQLTRVGFHSTAGCRKLVKPLLDVWNEYEAMAAVLRLIMDFACCVEKSLIPISRTSISATRPFSLRCKEKNVSTCLDDHQFGLIRERLPSSRREPFYTIPPDYEVCLVRCSPPEIWLYGRQDKKMLVIEEGGCTVRRVHVDGILIHRDAGTESKERTTLANAMVVDLLNSGSNVLEIVRALALYSILIRCGDLRRHPQQEINAILGFIKEQRRQYSALQTFISRCEPLYDTEKLPGHREIKCAFENLVTNQVVAQACEAWKDKSVEDIAASDAPDTVPNWVFEYDETSDVKDIKKKFDDWGNQAKGNQEKFKCIDKTKGVAALGTSVLLAKSVKQGLLSDEALGELTIPALENLVQNRKTCFFSTPGMSFVRTPISKTNLVISDWSRDIGKINIRQNTFDKDVIYPSGISLELLAVASNVIGMNEVYCDVAKYLELSALNVFRLEDLATRKFEDAISAYRNVHNKDMPLRDIFGKIDEACGEDDLQKGWKQRAVIDILISMGVRDGLSRTGMSGFFDCIRLVNPRPCSPDLKIKLNAGVSLCGLVGETRHGDDMCYLLSRDRKHVFKIYREGSNDFSNVAGTNHRMEAISIDDFGDSRDRKNVEICGILVL